MRVIQKQISLEQFKSRMPSVIPAYDENGMQHNFTHFIDLLNEPLVNYNMLPFDVQVDENSDLGKYSGKLFTYQALVEIFHKLDSYYNKELVFTCKKIDNISDVDKKFYEWLLEKCFPFFIFDLELVNYSGNIDDVKGYWGTNRLSIKEVATWTKKMIELSNNTDSCATQEYIKRGGDDMRDALNVWFNSHIQKIICTHQDYGHDFVYEVKETDKNVTVKTVKGSLVVMHTFQIFEPRVRIFGNNRYIRYGRLDNGNNVLHPQTIEIIDGILTIPCLFGANDNVLIVSEPSFSVPLLLTNSMNNIGEMTSICEDWDDGYEYNQNILNSSQIDYSGGPMVYYNGDNWILKSYSSPGYIYSTKYQEVYFGSEEGMTDEEYEYFNDDDNEFKDGYEGREQWERYVDYLPKISDLNFNTYTYKKNQLMFNPNPLSMGEKIEIDTNENNGYYLYNNNVYPNHICDSIEFQGKIYEVFYVYEVDGIKRNPYVYINGIQMFINKSNCTPNQGHQYTITSGGSYIQYVDELRIVSNDNKYDGFVEYNGEKILFRKNGSGVMQNSQNNTGTYKDYNILSAQTNNFFGYTTFVENGKWYAIFAKPFEVYNGDKVSGETSSRLSDLISNVKFAVDNIGHTFFGLMPYKTFNYTSSTSNYTYSTYVTNPHPNDWLSIPYIPKHVNDLEEIENNIFWGNIINKVTFEYDIHITHVSTDNSILSPHNKEFTTRTSNIIDSYKKPTGDMSAFTYVDVVEAEYHFVQICENNDQLKEMEEILKNNYSYCTNIICNIEYYVGTIIQKKLDEYDLKLNSNNEYYGIKFIDTLYLEKKQCLYYYDEMDTCILNYWEMKHEKRKYNNDTYNVRELSEDATKFEFKTQPFELQYGYKLYKNDGIIKFYKIDELSETVQYNNVEYPIEIIGKEKCFSVKLKGSEILRVDYKYYIINDGKRVYAKNVNNEKLEIKIGDITYESSRMQNVWVDVDDEDASLPNDVYCQIPIKLYLITPENTTDIYFDWKNNMSVAPLIFNENKLGQATQEKISGNIYIDRGTVRAIDYHLRLLEAKSLESLEQIGNGFFNIKSNNELK